MAQIKKTNENPLSDLISDDIYYLLDDNGLIDQRGVRNFHIRQRYQDLRERETCSFDAIDEIQMEYPNLQFDTIKKIVYAGGSKRTAHS